MGSESCNTKGHFAFRIVFVAFLLGFMERGWADQNKNEVPVLNWCFFLKK